MTDPWIFSPQKPLAERLPDISKPQRSVDYLIEEIRDHSFYMHVPISRYDLDVLAMSVVVLVESGVAPRLQDLMNRSVYIIRGRIEWLKSEGLRCIQARPGLRVPALIEEHYEILYQTNHRAFISAVMQNAFFGNPQAGETKPWRSPKGRLQ